MRSPGVIQSDDAGKLKSSQPKLGPAPPLFAVAPRAGNELRVTPDTEEQLIRQIYAAAFDQELWVDVMERLADAVGGMQGCLSRLDITDEAAAEAILFRSDPRWLDAHTQHFGNVNVFRTVKDLATYHDIWEKAVQTDEDCLSRDDYHASEYYNDFLRPQGVDRALFIRLGLSGTVVSTVNIGRRVGEAFEPADLAFAARLQPHMMRSYEVSRQIAQPSGVVRNLAEALQQSPHALFLVEPGCALTYANRVGERLLARDRSLIVFNGRLTPSHTDAARQFERLVGQAAHQDRAAIGGVMSVTRPTGGTPLAVRTSPLPRDMGPVYRATRPVLVTVTDLDAEIAAPSAQLKILFSMTAAEIRLAVAVFEGLSLPEAAEQFGLSTNTLRFQLARIFDKTGVSRQAELVKLMMRLAS